MDVDLDLPLVDRINLNYKTDLSVPFDTVEQDFIARIDALRLSTKCLTSFAMCTSTPSSMTETVTPTCNRATTMLDAGDELRVRAKIAPVVPHEGSSLMTPRVR